MTLPKDKIEYFRKKLIEEQAHLEGDLSHVAKKNPNVPGDWEITPADLNTEPADKNEQADNYEEMEARAAIGEKLEERLTFVNQALERVEKGTYGICEECNEPINEKRLEANIISKYCIKHAKNGH